MRLEGKVAIVTGAGQTRSDSIGNGRTAALLFAREGAKLLVANRSTASLDEALELLRKEGLDGQFYEMAHGAPKDRTAQSAVCRG
jgi:NAD(P)-dependent dehydrogenase (short-subunit alcohol dehydrogenase family)